MIEISKEKPIIRLYVTDRNRIEGDAIRQLEKSGEAPGMKVVVGMPDLHPGKGGPVGAAFLTENRIYPFLLGSDVGCGMALFATGLKKKKIKRDKWAKKLSGLQTPWEGNAKERLAERGISTDAYSDALGTIGGGNHFAELQAVQSVEDLETFQAIGLDEKMLTLLVHSGSRGLGDSLLRSHTSRNGAKGLLDTTEEAKTYLKKHAEAVEWARANRALIAERFLSRIGSSPEPILDLSHNYVQKTGSETAPLWLHRKGVAASDGGPVIIPGTRGSLSYLVLPMGDQEPNLFSAPHGAGRKWNRKSARDRMKARWKVKSLMITELGGAVICEDRDLMFEEAPQAYKNIDSVIKEMTDQNLIRVIATFRPVITYKMRKQR